MKHIFTVIILLFTISTKAQIGIGTITPDASARLQVDANASTNAKGFLPPRVTATERAGVVSPATGLIVYQTDGTKGFYYYDGTAWNLLTIATSTVPYTGATKSVNLGAYDLTVNGITVGKGAGNVSSNTANGASALYSNTTGSLNTASGYRALYSNIIGDFNTASGYQALYSNTTGSQNTASGYWALYSNIIGDFNTASGHQALYLNTEGIKNTASGFEALSSNATGGSNTANGYQALMTNTTGSNNTAIGYSADVASGAMTNATAIGNGAIVDVSNTIQLGNTSVTNVKTSGTITAGDVTYPFAHGAANQVLSTTGSGTLTWTTPSTSVPYTGATLAVNLGAYDLTVNGLTLGKGAGNFNTVIGDQALFSNSIGYNNTASGYQALKFNTEGENNTASGYQALYNNTTGDYNTANGAIALFSNITGNSNIAIGYHALANNTTGNQNTASGYRALYSNTEGEKNIAIGYHALYSNITGVNNTASGFEALYFTTTGGSNTALGYGAGFFLTTGSNNILLGNNAQPSVATVSNEITLGNSSVTTLRSQATTITALSDRRDKTDIIPIVEGLAFLKQLNPVSFTWNTRDKAKVGIKSAGFIAQELLALQKQSNIGDNLDLVSENNPEKLEARYGNLLPVIVKAIQEESAEKDKEIKALKERLDALEKQITQMLKK